MRSANSSGVTSHRRRSQPLPLRGVRSARADQHVDERVGKRLRILGLDEYTVLVVADEVDDPARARSDDRPTAAERLEHDARQPLRAGGQHERGRLVELLRDLFGREGRIPACPSRQIGEQLFDDLPTTAAADERSSASGTRGAASRHAPASTSTALYFSSTPTKRSAGRAGNGLEGEARKALKSTNAGNSATGSTPSSRTSVVVKSESVRTPSTRCSPILVIRSIRGATARRNGDPYSLVVARQSPWRSATTRASLRPRSRPSKTAGASCNP